MLCRPCQTGIFDLHDTFSKTINKRLANGCLFKSGAQKTLIVIMNHLQNEKNLLKNISRSKQISFLGKGIKLNSVRVRKLKEQDFTVNSLSIVTKDDSKPSNMQSLIHL